MGVWIANKDEYGQYLFNERVWPDWYKPENIEVATVEHYRNIIKDSNITYYLYSCERLDPKALEEMKSDWLSFYVPS
ncbi:hypothetical protein [Acinetobacter sp. ANC 4862]|jgi:hypothetical protein|uniref:hypothetical protein n=1 Tax=Acinetobacter sp. ANC 4862 TaxID=2529849 RepID=UPI00103E9CDF|nr:hypothetical protein [Acinetobacter sp. ANC 4862]TCH63597.1 hypothetical protein E0409_09455 [Acinetobacter sp. ANC 4862]